MKTTWEELELDVDYVYEPACDAVMDVNSPLCGPAWPSTLDIIEISFRGIEILMAFTADEIEKMEKQLLIEHEKDLCDKYEG